MKKVIRLIGILIMIVTLTMGILPSNITTINAQAATKSSKLVLNKSSVTITIGKTVQLKIVNGNNKKKNITWKSSDKQTATVSRTGKVKAINVGYANITAMAGSKSVTCIITVKADESKNTTNTSDTDAADTDAYQRSTITITFNSRGGTPVEPITLPVGGCLSSIPTTDRNGCDLAYWCMDNGETYFDDYDAIKENTQFYKDTTLSAVWRTGKGYTEYDYASEWCGMVDFDSMIDTAKSQLATFITDGMTEFDQVKAVHDYMVKNTYYDDAESTDEMDKTSFNAAGPILKGKAVCSGYAYAFWVYMDILNIDCEFVIGTESMNHAWNLVKVDGEWYHIDVTWDDPLTCSDDYKDGDTSDFKDGSNMSYYYFLLSDAKMSQTHEWDTSEYVKCTSTKYDNYIKVIEDEEFVKEYGMTREEYDKEAEAVAAKDFLSEYGVTYEEFTTTIGTTYYGFDKVYGMSVDDYLYDYGATTTNALLHKMYLYGHDYKAYVAEYGKLILDDDDN